MMYGSWKICGMIVALMKRKTTNAVKFVTRTEAMPKTTATTTVMKNAFLRPILRKPKKTTTYHNHVNVQKSRAA